jgi:hypothetical protein
MMGQNPHGVFEQKSLGSLLRTADNIILRLDDGKGVIITQVPINSFSVFLLNVKR